eukprot:455170-Rhodomonas_salina.2
MQVCSHQSRNSSPQYCECHLLSQRALSTSHRYHGFVPVDVDGTLEVVVLMLEYPRLPPVVLPARRNTKFSTSPTPGTARSKNKLMCFLGETKGKERNQPSS